MNDLTQSLDKENKDIYILPRGGIMARTSAGLIQVGASPETIKDSMVKEREVPQIYLLPDLLFDFENGISTADFEFPMYYNFYIKNRKTFLIGHEADLKKVDLVLREALFGPARLDISRDYVGGKHADTFPKIRKEMNFFKFSPEHGRRIIMEDLVDFIPLKEGEVYKYNGIEIINKDEKNYFIKDKEKEFSLPKKFLFPPPAPIITDPDTNFSPPLFGITIIGSSHGFDPGEKTTGFIIWINKKGILVDPPVHSTRWLEEKKINTKMIGDLILTHCHADHDSGTLQKILEERRINLHTTKTIKESFLRKYSILTDIPHKFLEKMLDFHPVILGKSHKILGADFLFKYSFHSIPTVWFETKFHNKSFVYSSDMFNHPPTIKKLREQHVMSKKRAEEFLKFPWHHNLILHEAGIPPIHTPLSVLVELDEEVKQKLYLIHVSARSIPEGKGLRLAQSGIKNTIICPIKGFVENATAEKLEIISKVDLFQKADPEKLSDIIDRTYYQEFSPGEHIIKVGDKGDKFYIIQSGEAIIKVNEKYLKTYSNYDYFGETSIVFQANRNADVYAKTHIKLLVMDEPDLLYLISNSDIIEKAQNLAIVRDLHSWELFDTSHFLKSFSPTQKTELQAIMKYQKISKGQRFIKEGEKACYAYLIKTGIADIYKNKKLIHEAKKGELIAKISFSRDYPYYDVDVSARDEVELFKMSMASLNPLLNKNPGMKVKMIKLNPLNKF